jgi:hypothetical protein
VNMELAPFRYFRLSEGSGKVIAKHFTSPPDTGGGIPGVGS